MVLSPLLLVQVMICHPFRFRDRISYLSRFANNRMKCDGRPALIPRLHGPAGIPGLINDQEHDVYRAGSFLLASIVKLPALRAAIHKNSCGLSSGVRKIRLFGVAAGLGTVNVVASFPIVTVPTEFPWTSTFPITCSATPLEPPFAVTPNPLSVVPETPVPVLLEPPMPAPLVLEPATPVPAAGVVPPDSAGVGTRR